MLGVAYMSNATAQIVKNLAASHALAAETVSSLTEAPTKGGW
jgi:hypothetical protein